VGVFFFQLVAPYLGQVPVGHLAVITLTTTINSVLRSGNDGVKLLHLANEIADVIETEHNQASLRANVKQAARDDQAAPQWQRDLVKDTADSMRALARLNRKMRYATNGEPWDTAVKVPD
jgi:GAF domain-containing protein